MGYIPYEPLIWMIKENEMFCLNKKFRYNGSEEYLIEFAIKNKYLGIIDYLMEKKINLNVSSDGEFKCSPTLLCNLFLIENNNHIIYLKKMIDNNLIITKSCLNRIIYDKSVTIKELKKILEK